MLVPSRSFSFRTLVVSSSDSGVPLSDMHYDGSKRDFAKTRARADQGGEADACTPAMLGSKPWGHCHIKLLHGKPIVIIADLNPQSLRPLRACWRLPVDLTAHFVDGHSGRTGEQGEGERIAVWVDSPDNGTNTPISRGKGWRISKVRSAIANVSLNFPTLSFRILIAGDHFNRQVVPTSHRTAGVLGRSPLLRQQPVMPPTIHDSSCISIEIGDLRDHSNRPPCARFRRIKCDLHKAWNSIAHVNRRGTIACLLTNSIIRNNFRDKLVTALDHGPAQSWAILTGQRLPIGNPLHPATNRSHISRTKL